MCRCGCRCGCNCECGCRENCERRSEQRPCRSQREEALERAIRELGHDCREERSRRQCCPRSCCR